MAKFEEPFDETQELYSQAIENADLTRFVNITILTNNKSKEIFKVVKANDILSHIAKTDLVIVINEKILDQLTPAQRLIVVEESLACIHFDSEANKIVISKPDVVTFSGILRKHQFETWNILRESIKTLYNVEKQAEDEAKAAKAAKAKK